MDSHSVDSQSLAALGIFAEKFAQMDAFKFLIVLLEQCPGVPSAQRRYVPERNVSRVRCLLALTGCDCHVDQLALRMTALFDSMQDIRSLQDLSNDTAPSS